MLLSQVKLFQSTFFVIDACHNEHDDIILGRPFLKLVNAVLDAGKGRVTIDLDGTKFTYDFLPASRIALPLPLDNEEVEDLCFVDTFKDPLQRAMENDAMYDDQDKELAEAIEGLKHMMKVWMKKIMKILEICNNKNPKCLILS
jgi:hypothetical protein